MVDFKTVKDQRITNDNWINLLFMTIGDKKVYLTPYQISWLRNILVKECHFIISDRKGYCRYWQYGEDVPDEILNLLKKLEALDGSDSINTPTSTT